MKTKMFYSALACILFWGAAIAQKATIVASEGKYIERTNGTWEDWPSSWFEYDNYPVVYITEKNKGSYGDIYNIAMYMDGEELINTDVTFDPDVSTQKRKDWDDEYVNCYKDENGDYMYLSGLSLDSLVKDPDGWKNSANEAKMYIWAFSGDWAVVIRY